MQSKQSKQCKQSKHAERLFPELPGGASLRWYIYLLRDGDKPDTFRISRDPEEAIAARRAGLFVRLSPRYFGAVRLLRRDLEPASL